MLMKSGGLRPATASQPDTRTPVGVNIGTGGGLIIVAALVAAPIPGADQQARLAVVAIAVGLWAALTVDHRALAAVVVLGWLVADGFLENRLGELSWHGSTDVYLLMFLVMAGAVGLAVGETARQLARLRARWRTEAQFRAIVTPLETVVPPLETAVAPSMEKEKHRA